MAPFNAGMKIAKWIDPATHYEFQPPHGRPYIMSPYAACMNTFAAYPAPDALSRAIVLSHHDAQHPHHDGPEEGSFVPTEVMNDKHKWIERPHWSFLGLKGDPRVDDFLASHSNLVLPPPASGASLHPANETSTRPGLSQRSSSLALGTLPQSSIPARSDSPPPFAAESGGVGFWGAPIPRQDDSGTSTPASSAAEDTPKKKKGSRFSLASLRHALDTSSSSSTDGAHDHITTADQLLAPGASSGGRDRAQSVGSAYKPNADVLKQLGPWRFADESVDAAEVRPCPLCSAQYQADPEEPNRTPTLSSSTRTTRARSRSGESTSAGTTGDTAKSSCTIRTSSTRRRSSRRSATSTHSTSSAFRVHLALCV